MNKMHLQSMLYERARSAINAEIGHIASELGSWSHAALEEPRATALEEKICSLARERDALSPDVENGLIAAVRRYGDPTGVKRALGVLRESEEDLS